MSTLTPNLGLYKPDSNDPIADFRTEFNNNMDILDNSGGGGGGGGGHTIVDENGQSMPSRLKLAFTGNVEVTDDSGNNETLVNILGGGGGGSDTIAGMYVDTSRIITSGTWSSSLSYTATEDCFVYVEGTTNNTHLIVNVDGVKVFDLGSSNFVAQYKLYPLKKGQILTATKSDGFTLNYIVYGVTQGTKNIFTPIIYSDNERCIGIWRDNKPLYQKTIDFGTLPNQTTKSVAHGISDIDSSCIVSIEPIASTSSCATFPRVHDTNVANQVFWEVDSTNIICYSRNSNNTAFTRCFVTLKYTKTSDSAGSGNWNTDGVPTHHYSTSEQVVGTWLGKTLYQRVWDFGSDVVIPNNAFYTTSIDATVIETIVEGFGIYSTGATRYNLMPNTNGVNIRLQADRTNGSANVRYFVMSYTKTTD